MPTYSATPYEMRTIDPLKVTIPTALKPYYTFDSSARKFFWTDDTTAKALVNRTDLKVEIALYNENNVKATFNQQILVSEQPNTAPAFVNF